MTGIPVVQVTNHPSINHPTYFLQSSFLPDGSGMIFTSYRTGSAQLFEASLRTGELKQLTDGPAIHPFSPAISGEHIYFVRGGSIWRLQRSTLVEEQIVAVRERTIGRMLAQRRWRMAYGRDQARRAVGYRHWPGRRQRLETDSHSNAR